MAGGKGLNQCGVCIKYFMFVFNVISLLAGIAVVAVSVWTIVDKFYLEAILGVTLYIAGAYMLVAAGCIIIILSLFACLGAIREMKCLLISYFVLILLIFIALVCGGIFAWIYRGRLQSELKEKLKVTMVNDYGREEELDKTRGWDYLQATLHCCAVNQETSWKVWRNTYWGYETPAERVPVSCCINGRELECKDNNKFPATSYLYTTGCYDKAYSVMLDNLAAIGGVGVGIACLMVIGMVCALALVRQIH
ncbi:PREDICTED: CD151 antigen-like [Priapulus caudatus]|uniref:Tetraspanin n=1 Tax=Priapulus caudatus TaxID=37621 RepID=A0ABM1DVR4_PRICU|nr:PREDICTED: CD151 antigen-like [Priapulus caudatus]XP_014664036.1 PREDICTED: CD151 antigen-like [Priapulus caudatus]